MHIDRTHNCGALRPAHVGETVRLSGWVHSKRDHGNLLFIDLRDHFGLTQCVVERDGAHFQAVEAVRPESVVTVTGRVVARSDDTVNPNLDTGRVEVRIGEFVLQSGADMLPMQVAGAQTYSEEMRLRYRFLDLRRTEMQRNIMLRSAIIASIRRRMIEQGFSEFQTPILTSSSPEGARDFLVPSRLHPGRFYALPQAPQQFKQLIMVSGFDRYFQIAPCFRDEDARADRSPGEFYQLDMEMAFATQEDAPPIPSRPARTGPPRSRTGARRLSSAGSARRGSKGTGPPAGHIEHGFAGHRGGPIPDRPRPPRRGAGHPAATGPTDRAGPDQRALPRRFGSHRRRTEAGDNRQRR